MEKNETFIKCDCGTEFLHLQHDNEDGWKSFYLSFWQYGSPSTISFFQRIKWAWKVLTKGNLYGDQLILSEKSALELKDYIQKNLPLAQEEKIIEVIQPKAFQQERVEKAIKEFIDDELSGNCNYRTKESSVSFLSGFDCARLIYKTQFSLFLESIKKLG